MMRDLLLLLLAAAASAQDNPGFVKPKLAKEPTLAKLSVVEVSRPALQTCAIPLLEAQVGKEVERMPVLKPGVNTDPKMILPAIPVCGKK